LQISEHFHPSSLSSNFNHPKNYEMKENLKKIVSGPKESMVVIL
jgi:hypothetical protein